MFSALDVRGNRIIADSASRGEEYFCPKCRAALVFKKGRVVTPHFAHSADSACRFGEGESARHLAMKAAMGRMCAITDEVQYEVEFSPIRRADIVLPKRRVVVECQASKLQTEEWIARTRDYTRLGYAVLWIWDMGRFTMWSGNTEVRVPDEIRHCHKEAYGKIYVLSDVTNDPYPFTSVHLDAVFRENDWDEAVSAGHYLRTVREATKKPLKAPLRPFAKKSASGMLLADLGEGIWWKTQRQRQIERLRAMASAGYATDDDELSDEQKQSLVRAMEYSEHAAEKIIARRDADRLLAITQGFCDGDDDA